jgi:starch-binding outer membrane protein, SusD/RagB family
MKFMKKIFWVTAILCIINACSLDEEPYGFLDSKKFYKSDSDAISALAHSYDVLADNDSYGRYISFMASLGTEEFTLKESAGQNDKEFDGWNVSGSNLVLFGVWYSSYRGIASVNSLLEGVPTISMDETLKNEILGEAHFLRALHYFNLVRLYGKVPLRTKVVTSASEVPVPVSELSDIYDFIEQDLIKAEELTGLTIREGRANRVAVQGLLAKVYLHMASSKDYGVTSYSFVSSADDYYGKAATYAKKVLDNSAGYQLYTGTNLFGMWDVDNQVANPSKPESQEFIFSVGYQRVGAISEGDYNKYSQLMVPTMGGNMDIGPDYTIKNLNDGWGHLQTEIVFYDTFDDTDKRKTELFVSKVKIGGVEKTYPGSMPYPFSRKFIDKGQVSDQTSHAIPVIRFSDIALVFAEASGATAEAYTIMNQIRSRAGLDDVTPGLNNADFRKEVLKERVFELAFENSRLFDLRRTNTVLEVLEGQFKKKVGPHAYEYPIPQIEKDNNSAID